MSAADDNTFAELMMRKYGGTTWTGIEVFQLGEAVLSQCVAVVQLGWASPASSLDYVPRNLTGNAPQDLLYDFIAWTSGRKKLRPGCEERIRHEIAESGFQRFVTERVGAAFAAAMKDAAS